MRKWRHSFTILDLDTSWRWVVTFVPLQLNYRGNPPPPPNTIIGNWVCSRAGLDVTQKRKISYPYRKSNPVSSVVQRVAQSIYRPSHRYGWVGILKKVGLYIFIYGSKFVLLYLVYYALLRFIRGSQKGKRPLGRFIRRFEDNIKI
jgi:hypothetical protein